MRFKQFLQAKQVTNEAIKDSYIGKTWESKNGKRSIIGIESVDDEDYYKIATDGSTSIDYTPVSVIDKQIAVDAKQATKEDQNKQKDYDKKAKQEAERESKKKEAEEKEYNDIDGFEKGMTPKKRGQVLKVLSKILRVNGQLITRKNHIRKLVKDGKSVNETGTIMGDKDSNGNVFGFNIGKIGGQYANFLIDNKIKIKIGG